jgi:hypothetical protein
MLSATPTASDQLCFHDSGHRHDGVLDGPGDSSAPGPSHFVDIYLVRQDAAALLSSQKEHEQLFWHCAKCYWASVPVFFAQHFGFQQRGEAVPPLRKSSQERLLKLSLWRFPAAYRA